MKEVTTFSLVVALLGILMYASSNTLPEGDRKQTIPELSPQQKATIEKLFHQIFPEVDNNSLSFTKKKEVVDRYIEMQWGDTSTDKRAKINDIFNEIWPEQNWAQKSLYEMELALGKLTAK